MYAACRPAIRLGSRTAREVLVVEAMKKPAPKKLALSAQSLRPLLDRDLADVAGGWIRPRITISCPQPSGQTC